MRFSHRLLSTFSGLSAWRGKNYRAASVRMLAFHNTNQCSHSHNKIPSPAITSESLWCCGCTGHVRFWLTAVMRCNRSGRRQGILRKKPRAALPQVRLEPMVSDSAHCTNDRYHESCPKLSTTIWVLNGVLGSVDQRGFCLCQNGAF